MVLPHHIHRSRFPLHRLSKEAGEAQNQQALLPATESNFLLLPGDCQQAPVMVGHLEIARLHRIDGRRALKTVLKKVHHTELKRAMSFMWYLVQAGAIELV